MRLALRTGDYHVAVRRMARVLGAVSEYEVQPDLASRALAMMAQMRRFNMALSDPNSDELVQRKTLELLVSRLIDEARWRNHPLTTDPADFGHTWLVFTNGHIPFRRSRRQACSTAGFNPPLPGRACRDARHYPRYLHRSLLQARFSRLSK